MMKLKKCNAVLSLLTVLAMFLHVGYSAYTYLTFYYDPALTVAFAVPFAVLTCLHAVLGMCSVFFLSDGTRMSLYGKQNIRTIVQRLTAALIFPLLLLHIKTFDLLNTAASSGQYALFALLILAQVVFYLSVFAHASVSFSRALITLGWLSSKKAQRITDRVMGVLCTVLFFVTCYAVIKGQIVMFLFS